MSRLDEDLRSTLRGGTPHVDVDAFLADVHRGARRRRQRRAVGIAAAAVLVAAGVAGVFLPGSGPHSAPPVAGTGTPSPTTSPSPTMPTEVPTDDAGRPLETGVFGFDASADGRLWRVSAVGCGPVSLCSRVSSYDGAGRWTTLADLPWAHPRRGEVQAPAEHVTVAPDGQDAWAYGGEAWSSHDAGRTWTRLDLPLQHTGVGEVVVVGDTAVLRTNDGRLLRSNVGADDWTALPRPQGTTYAEQVLAVGDVLLVRGRDADYGLTVATSSDGGADWSAQSAPCNAEQPAWSVTAGSVFALCPGDPSVAPGDQTAHLLRTDDDGHSWQQVLTIGARVQLEAALSLDRSSVYVVSGQGEMLLFPEGEKQYGDVVPLGKDGTVNDGRFVTPEHGYLLLGSPRALLETTDGGRTWNPIG